MTDDGTRRPTPASTGRRTPTALTIAGSDPSGGAGIQADLKSFAALGAYGASVIVALTAQNTQGVTGIHVVPADFVKAQLEAIFCDLHVPAAKVGMLGTAEITRTVADALAERPDMRLVVDPVMLATSGDVLLAPDAEAVLREQVLPLADLLTPNLPEAARLLGSEPAQTEADAIAQAQALRAKGAKAVLVKGGHSLVDTDEAVDILADASGIHRFAAPRIATPNTHGTGCTLSAAIVAGLTQDLSLREAIAQAKRFVTAGLEAGARLSIGHGHGPLDHTVRL